MHISSLWLLLVVSLPTHSATGRMRVWRALKALGCGSLRDGNFLLPHSQAHVEQLAALADETVREGGTAWLLTVVAQSDNETAAYHALFDRTAEHDQFRLALSEARQMLSSATHQEIGRTLRKMRRDYDALRAIDYFPSDASVRSDVAWSDFASVAELLLSPGEPQQAGGELARLDAKTYQGRRWATRQGLWVDRVASAWLILRFIDPSATFLWLDTPADCPKDALGFDFDGATFTHVAERVTFEVLLASFGLEHDKGLVRMGAMVHALDVGGAFVPEASGFEAMLAGARQRATDDDQLLAAMTIVLDGLHTHFGSESLPTT